MAKRDVSYTSISISKTHLPLINKLKDYAQQQHGLALTSQLVTDFALELAWEQKDKLKEYANEHLEDPRVAQLRKLEAETKRIMQELAAEGKAPKSK